MTAANVSATSHLVPTQIAEVEGQNQMIVYEYKTGRQHDESVPQELKEPEKNTIVYDLKDQREKSQPQVTFYERKAFVDDFRRKWREDKGMVSLFDKRQKYRLANQRVKSAVTLRGFGARNIPFGTRNMPVGSFNAKQTKENRKTKIHKGICIKGSQANIDQTLSAATAAK